MESLFTLWDQLADATKAKGKGLAEALSLMSFNRQVDTVHSMITERVSKIELNFIDSCTYICIFMYTCVCIYVHRCLSLYVCLYLCTVYECVYVCTDKCILCVCIVFMCCMCTYVCVNI